MNLLSNLSIYDTLTMMVSGYLWLLLVTGIQTILSNNILFFIACYIVGLVYHRIIDQLPDCLRNNKRILKNSHNEIEKESHKNLDLSATKNNYYKAYYCLMQKNCLGNIPILEAQVAFIRNVTPILAVYLVALCSGCKELCNTIRATFGNLCTVCIALFLIIIVLIFIRYATQFKICKLVWEGTMYINKVLQ